MGDKSVQISKLDCLKKIDGLVLFKPKHQKLGNFENIQEILSEYDVSVTQAMTEAAFFTIGRSRTIGYGKIRPLAGYRSRSRMLIFFF